jgi:bacillithiol system protein YtxJ
MGKRELSLPDAPTEALQVIREASRGGPVLVLKLSPICGVSAFVTSDLDRWFGARDSDEVVITVAQVDVIGRRSLGRGLTAELGIRHESPQALWFVDGELVWHGSHGEVTGHRLDELLAG